MLYPRNHDLFPLPKKLSILPRTKKESALWDFFPKLLVPVKTKDGGKKRKRGSRGQTTITSSLGVLSKNVDMPKLRELAANENTDLRRDWPVVLCSVSNTSNLRDKLVSLKYIETDQKVIEYFENEKTKVCNYI